MTFGRTDFFQYSPHPDHVEIVDPNEDREDSGWMVEAWISPRGSRYPYPEPFPAFPESEASDEDFAVDYGARFRDARDDLER